MDYDDLSLCYHLPSKSVDECRSEFDGEFIGEGSTRDVFRVDDGVVKVAREGTSQNRAEINVWETASPQQRENLAEVKDYDTEGFHWLVMEEVDIDGPGFINYEKEHYKTLVDIGFSCSELGVSDNGKIFDYGACNRV